MKANRASTSQPNLHLEHECEPSLEVASEYPNKDNDNDVAPRRSKRQKTKNIFWWWLLLYILWMAYPEHF